MNNTTTTTKVATVNAHTHTFDRNKANATLKQNTKKLSTLQPTAHPVKAEAVVGTVAQACAAPACTTPTPGKLKAEVHECCGCGTKR
ncbi:MAG: hypothetical protein JWO31_736 [Phycisphaerales bacterium]|nr:hypothetical protein [Phycisphaerales bacterium]